MHVDARIVRFLGVYDADGGIAGELRYVVGHLLGSAECALCDVTHSPVRRKRAWDAFVATLDVPFDLRHRNELTDAEQDAVLPMGLPVVAAETEAGWVPLLDRAALERCAGDVDTFAFHLTAATSTSRSCSSTPGRSASRAPARRRTSAWCARP